MTRRDLFKTATAPILARVCRARKPDRFNTKLKIGIQSFSLRHLPFDQMLETVSRLGLRYFETFEEHLPASSSAERLERVKRRLAELDLILMTFGVVGIDKSAPERNQQIFNFARDMELYSISANPEPETLDSLEGFTEDSGIRIAIHPHGPEYDRYPGWKAVQKAIAGRHSAVGICMDVGHVTRAGEDPIEGLVKLRNRVYGVHLKDLDRQNRNVILGKGRLDIPRILAILELINYRGVVSLEYEMEDGTDPLPGIRESLEYLEKILG